MKTLAHKNLVYTAIVIQQQYQSGSVCLCNLESRQYYLSESPCNISLCSPNSVCVFTHIYMHTYNSGAIVVDYDWELIYD